MNLLLPVLVFWCLITTTITSKILLLAPFPGPSHLLMLDKITAELLSRGHEVTAVTSFKSKLNSQNKNYTEVLIDPPMNLKLHFDPAKIFQKKFSTDIANIMSLYLMGIESSAYGLKNPKVQQLISREDLSFDLVISEQFFQESFLMFAYKFRAPIVTISTYGHSDFMDRAMGLYTPVSHIPHSFLFYTENMSFLEKCYNIVISLYDAIFRKFYYMYVMNNMAEEAFKPLTKYGDLPYIEDLEKSISVILVNDHDSLSPPRPKMPGTINIGGATILPPKPLPEDLQEILDNADDGVIYFSLGAYMESSLMPKEKMKMFLNVFSKLKQVVLWKWEDDMVEDVPKNVILRKWMPQGDILPHHNVRIFISHGGLFGTFEAIHWGVPMLIMPFYGDQKRNSFKATTFGFGKTLDFTEITETSLRETLNEMLWNETYKEKMTELSERFRDNTIPPMQETMYWIEYVIRHKGAAFLKSQAVNLNWFSYSCFDVISLAFLIFIIALVTSYNVLDYFVNKRWKPKVVEKKKKSKANKSD